MHERLCIHPICFPNVSLPQLAANWHQLQAPRVGLISSWVEGDGLDLLCDASWTEAGLQQTIRRAAPRCHLVQVADYVYGDRSIPCRAVPGDGTIPVRRLIGDVLETGYDGAFDLELLGPRIDREGHLAAVSRSADYVGGILQSLGV